MHELFTAIHAKILIAIVGSASAGVVSFIVLDDAHIQQKRKDLDGRQLWTFNAGVFISEVFVALFSGMFLGVPFALTFGFSDSGMVATAIIASLLGRKLIASIRSVEVGDAIVDAMISRFKKK
jgi:hypothetical protein